MFLFIQNVVCSSKSSISTRRDPNELKAELVAAKEHVENLKRELDQINSEISYTQRGVNTLYKYVSNIRYMIAKIHYQKILL